MKKKLITVCEIPTDDFTAWLEHTRKSLDTNAEAEVPCGECNACCRSSYFIHVRPDDDLALTHIPKELLFPAPGLPKGNLLLGYNEKGECPMLIDNKCSIYDYRPRTCRQYDCRILKATGLINPEDEQPIPSQARRWKFNYPAETDKLNQAALNKAMQFLISNADSFPAGFLPANEVQQAVLAIKVYQLFSTYNSDVRGSNEKMEKSSETKSSIISRIVNAVDNND